MAPLDRRDRFAAARASPTPCSTRATCCTRTGPRRAKNQVRWQFGVLAPRREAEVAGSERWSMGTSASSIPAPAPTLHVRLRCLQLAHRTIEAAAPAAASSRSTCSTSTAPSGWRGTKRSSTTSPSPNWRCCPVAAATSTCRSTSPGGLDIEELRAAGRDVVGRAVRGAGRRRSGAASRRRGPRDPAPSSPSPSTVENVTDWCGRRARRDEVDAPVARRRAHDAGRRRRPVRVPARPTAGGRRGRRRMRQRRRVPGARRPVGRSRAGLADHPLRPSGDRPGEHR